MNKVYGLPSDRDMLDAQLARDAQLAPEDYAACRENYRENYLDFPPEGVWRIVAVKKGDCVRGYRVKHVTYRRQSFRGTMTYSLEAAREMREFLKRQALNTVGTSFEEIE